MVRLQRLGMVEKDQILELVPRFTAENAPDPLPERLSRWGCRASGHLETKATTVKVNHLRTINSTRVWLAHRAGRAVGSPVFFLRSDVAEDAQEAGYRAVPHLQFQHQSGVHP